MPKQLTIEAVEILENEGLDLYASIDEYIEFIFSETNFHDGMIMLNALKGKIDDYILTQDEFYFIANTENIYTDIEDLFENLNFDGDIFI